MGNAMILLLLHLNSCIFILHQSAAQCNLPMDSPCRDRHSMGCEKGKVLCLTARDGTGMHKSDLSDSRFSACKSAGFGKDDITCIHIGRNMICKSKNPDLGILPESGLKDLP